MPSLLSQSDALARFHSDLLTAFNEPSLHGGGVSGTVFRFIRLDGWIGTISIVPNGQAADLTAKQLNYVGGHPPAKGAYIESSRGLTPAEWKRFRKLFDRTDFWNLPAANDSIGFDGCRWTCEVHEHNTYHLVHRWSPDHSAFARLCNYVMQLKDVKPARRRA